MAQDIPIRCDECRFVIGRLTTTVNGLPDEHERQRLELQTSIDQQMPKREQSAQQSIRISTPGRGRGFRRRAVALGRGRSNRRMSRRRIDNALKKGGRVRTRDEANAADRLYARVGSQKEGR
jgi:hypothetical protein